MVQILTSHVFFHLTMVGHHIASVLHRIILNHGAQLRWMQMEIMNLEYMENGETVTVTVTTHPATVEQVNNTKNTADQESRYKNLALSTYKEFLL